MPRAILSKNYSNRAQVNCMSHWLVGLLWAAVLIVPTAEAQDARLERQRADFVAAERALQQRDTVQYRQLRAGLRDYPLYPYLQLAELQGRLSSASSAEVAQFLEQYADIPIAPRLRQAWLHHLARQKRWADYVAFYTPQSSAELQCHYHWALHETGERSRALAATESLWLVGKSQPKVCDPLFGAWRRAGRLTPELAWRRVELAMEAGELGLAGYLKRYLKPEDRPWVDYWQELYRNPQRVLTTQSPAKDDPRARAIIVHTVGRLAGSDPAAAAFAWDRLQGQYRFERGQGAVLEQRIGVLMALRDRQRGMERLAAIEPELADRQTREWRVRTALALDDWHGALTWIERLSEEEQASDRWRYWRARALEATGRTDEAEALYDRLAGSRSYYGFLAADRQDLPYEFAPRPLAIADAQLSELEGLPGMRRARELFELNRMMEARREWQQMTAGLSQAQLNAVAKVAHRWGWHDRAILTLARTAYWDDLDLRFPLAHKGEVLAHADALQVDPAWAYAVMRQESAFMPDARSRAGAMGLMQIMPDTGRQVARLLNAELPHPNRLLDVKTNIRFGVTYLRRMLDHAEGNTVVATASYNAGFDRVRRWIPDDSALPADVWVDTIPFYETRDYLANVLAYTAIYEYRLGRDPARLTQRMPAIGQPLGALARGEGDQPFTGRPARAVP
jgi:soluble lytic murein transglycosylase